MSDVEDMLYAEVSELRAEVDRLRNDFVRVGALVDRWNTKSAQLEDIGRLSHSTEMIFIAEGIHACAEHLRAELQKLDHELEGEDDARR